MIENAISHFDSYGAKKVTPHFFGLYFPCSLKHVLEFEFFDEEGSGLGPTLEYFSLVAQELIKLDKLIWRKTEDGSLFPCPMANFKIQNANAKKTGKEALGVDPQAHCEKIQALFRMMGALVGRAILDERLIDLPIHYLFWDLVLDRVFFQMEIKNYRFFS